MPRKKGEKDSLLNTSGESQPAEGKETNGTFDETSGTKAKEAEKSGRTVGGVQKGKKFGTRGTLQKNPSMEKLDEEDTLKSDPRSRDPRAYAACPDYFGVKSYLHNFYDTHFYKDPSIYEDEDDFRYLLNPKQRRRRCTSIWWKVFVWIGANFLIFGIIGVLVGYLVPQKPVVVGLIGDNIDIIDRSAISFNFNLDVCKLVGLILFCIGGLTLTVALMFPSFLYQYCEDDGRDSSFRVRIGSEEKEPLKSPLEMSIPTTTMLSSVQPERKLAEAVVTQGGMVPID